ncbi:MAG: methylated-DNA--[protein]-cysteine S-methyltransferase [Candidatus Ancaeobacter aquaticus]|nr:methylated-DNA--[protein]-cysteine S-methyltransferase [Candidatus Ancaeobacter aquaticus]
MHTQMGNFICVYSQKGIRQLIFPARNEILCHIPENTCIKKTATPLFLKDLKEDIDSYFQGKKLHFTYQVDLSQGTQFQISVWKIIKDIPYGEYITYKDIAHRLNREKSWRAIGNACGKNPVPLIIPCHRVIRSDGALGGFSSGLSWKKRLLSIEKSI